MSKFMIVAEGASRRVYLNNLMIINQYASLRVTNNCINYLFFAVLYWIVLSIYLNTYFHKFLICWIGN